jgi:glutamine phosphoribosylpyrophosphate amidotransferase
VFGHPNAAILTYYGLFALQHRGQESAGIVTAEEPGSEFKRHVAMGLVGQVFNEQTLERLKGNRAVGHVRYFNDWIEYPRERSTSSWPIPDAARSRSATMATW